MKERTAHGEATRRIFLYNSGGNPYTMEHLPGLKNDRNEEALYENDTDGMQQ